MAKDTVLIADDDRTLVTLVAAFLRTKGFDVIPAFDSMQAMMGIRRSEPKAVILDINMPGGTGIEVVRKMKAMTKMAQIPVVILTGSHDRKLADEARGLGASEFLSKPVDLPMLYAALLRALGRPPEVPETPELPEGQPGSNTT